MLHSFVIQYLNTELEATKNHCLMCDNFYTIISDSEYLTGQ